MKKYIIVFLLIVNTIFAQNHKNQQFIDATDQSKSGNYKEILASLFQLGTSNLTGKNKSIEFNATLFAIKSIFNDSIKVDKNFVRERFSRNFQINTEINLDEEFKYKGISGGITYALINRRDKDVADFVNTELQFTYNSFVDELKIVVYDILKRNEAILTEEDKELIIKTLPLMLNSEFDKVDYSNTYIKEIIDEYEKRNKSIKLKDHIDMVHQLRDKEYSEIEKKPLWTVSLLGTTNDKGDNQKVSFGSVFLKGFNRFEMDIRSTLIYSDTLINTSIKRIQSKSSAGINYKLLRREKSEESLFEIKLYMEYNSVLKNVFEEEKKNTFFASTDFRIRIAKDVWIPITVKYDIENANLLGFLNITYNFGKPDENGKLKK